MLAGSIGQPASCCAVARRRCAARRRVCAARRGASGFFANRPRRPCRGGDDPGAGREHLVDALASGLAPIASDPHLMRFGWKDRGKGRRTAFAIAPARS
jgi:hypothetical protein